MQQQMKHQPEIVSKPLEKREIATPIAVVVSNLNPDLSKKSSGGHEEKIRAYTRANTVERSDLAAPLCLVDQFWTWL